MDVVAAIIWDGAKFLICQRPAEKRRALLWEFPGGKVEPGETLEDALKREIQEELGAQIEVMSRAAQASHRYSDADVHLFLFHARLSDGRPKRLEHNDMRWIEASQVNEFDFCPADREIVERIGSGALAAPDDQD